MVAALRRQGALRREGGGGGGRGPRGSDSVGQRGEAGRAPGGRVRWLDAPAGGVTRGGARRGRAGKLRLEKLRAAECLGGRVAGLPVSA